MVSYAVSKVWDLSMLHSLQVGGVHQPSCSASWLPWRGNPDTVPILRCHTWGNRDRNWKGHDFACLAYNPGEHFGRVLPVGTFTVLSRLAFVLPVANTLFQSPAARYRFTVEPPLMKLSATDIGNCIQSSHMGSPVTPPMTAGSEEQA